MLNIPAATIGVVLLVGTNVRQQLIAIGAALALVMSFQEATSATLCDSLVAGRYDIVYVCPGAWRTEVARLAIHRSEPGYGGYTSIIATLEGMSSCYGTGRSGIRNLIHHAMVSWSSPPQHIVLVGAFDSHDTTYSIVPTWFIDDPTIGFWDIVHRLVSTDDPYVFTPGSTDSTAALSLGRIPAWDVAGLHRYIDKVIEYDSQGYVSWKSRSLHIIDDGDFDGNSGYLIRQRADSLANSAICGRESYFSRSLLYWSAAPPNYLLPPIQAWNNGVGFVLGYGARGNVERVSYLSRSGSQWEPCGSPAAIDYSQPEQQLLDTLHTNHMYPVVLSMTCGSSHVLLGTLDPWLDPTLCSGISQYFLATASKGASVVIGPSRAIRETAAYGFARAWLQTGFGEADQQSTREPGRTTLSAKRQTMLHVPAYKNEILSVACLGDPALRMFVGNPTVVSVGSGAHLASLLAVRPASIPSRTLAFRMDVPKAGPYVLRVLDIQGRTIRKRTWSANAPISGIQIDWDGDNVPAGVYFLTVHNSEQVATAKIVLIR